MEAYGARLAVSAPDAGVLERVAAGLLGWELSSAEIPPDCIHWRFAVLRNDPFGFRIRDGHGRETVCLDLELAIGLLRTQMQRYASYHADDLIFVRAGVVAHGGRAIVIPGHSLSGKSTLVAALVRAGADYYSDEYAMLDDKGRVRRDRQPGSDGGRPAPIGVAAITTYNPGAEWRPRRLSAAEGVLAMMQHAVPARGRPAETLAVLHRALEGAIVLEGERGEADETAAVLLDAAVG